MPLIMLDVPARDEIEAKALIYDALSAYAEARLSAAASPLHGRWFRQEMTTRAARAAAAAQSLYPGDSAAGRDIRETPDGSAEPATILPLAPAPLPPARPPAPSRYRRGTPARRTSRDEAL